MGWIKNGGWGKKRQLLREIPPSRGNGMQDPAQERNEVTGRLARAVTLLENSMGAGLIPHGGASIAYAIRGARDAHGVAAVPGGIVCREGKVSAGGPCAFGADERSALLVLTVMKFDPHMRSAATIRFSEKVLAVFEAVLLECASIDRRREPPGTGTMDWSVAACCKDGVPDVMYDRGGDNQPALLHLFGEDPVGVANNIIICSNRI